MSDADEEAAYLLRVEQARRSGRPLRVLVCGSREWAQPEPILRELELLPLGTIVIHGDARGADRLAGQIAAELGFPVVARPAPWGRFGKGAGIIRNRQMLDDSPDVALAFLPSLAAARGTRHMVEIATEAGVPVKVIEG
jgi:hypothetical protein